jgi:hypothetical protein
MREQNPRRRFSIVDPVAPSSGLVGLRIWAQWHAAKVYFQNQITSRGANNVTADVAAFKARYAAMPCAAVVDAVLSVQKKYLPIVIPAMNTWMANNTAATLTSIAAHGAGAVPGKPVTWKGHATIQGVATTLLNFGGTNATDQQRMAAWATQAVPFRFHHRLDAVGAVSGIGPALFNYLLMRSGEDALKPDGRVKKQLKASGLTTSDRIDDLDALFLAEAMAEELNKSRLWFDKLLW